MSNELLTDKQIKLFEAISKSGELIFACGSRGIEANIVGEFFIRHYPERKEYRLEMDDGKQHVHIDWNRVKHAEYSVFHGEGVLSFKEDSAELFKLYKMGGDFSEEVKALSGILNDSKSEVFSNPVPVAVALIPYKNKLIGIRRGIEPRKGQVALPGGFINSGETFYQALSRELLEETGLIVGVSSWSVFEVGDSLQSNRILIFGLGSEVSEIDMKFKSDETDEIVLIDENTQLAFPLHQEAVKKYFKSNL